MFYLILAILSSTANGIILRLSKKFVKNKISMLAGNYLTCTLLSVFYMYPSPFLPSDEGMGRVMFLSLINGFILLAGFVLMQYCILNHGVVMTSVFSRLGVLVPALSAIIFFHEKPTSIQSVGFLLAISAIIIMNGRNGLKGLHFSLIAVLLMNGSGDFMAKVFEETGVPSLSENYLVFSFLTALSLNIVLSLYKKEHPGAGDIISGMILGIPNYFGARFLLKAVSQVPAFIVYPTFSVGNIIVMTISGILLFKEKITRNQLAAILIIMLSLVFLNI